VQLLKQPLESVSIDGGIQSDVSDTQPVNAHAPRVKTPPPGSNTKTESRAQLLKHDVDMISIDVGIEIDVSDEQFSNADVSKIET
jgi:hypothetical protein